MPAPLRVVGFASGWIVLLGCGWSAAAQAQEAPLVGDLRPGGVDRRGRPGLSRGDLPQRAGRAARTGCICGCSIPTPAASTTWSTTPRTTPRSASRCSVARAPTPARPGPASSPARSSSPRARRSASSVVAASAALDDRWQTLFSVAPEQGEAVGGRRVFRLQVEGVAGDDANLYAVTLSLRDRRNLAPRRARDRRSRADRAGPGQDARSPSCASGAGGRRAADRAQLRRRQRRARASSARSVRCRSPRRGRTNGARARSSLQPDERGQVAAITVRRAARRSRTT